MPTLSPFSLAWALLSGFETFWVVLAALVCLLLLVVIPVLAISAFVRVRRLERPAPGPPGERQDVSARLNMIEKRLERFERELAEMRALSHVAPPPPAEARAAQPTTPRVPPPPSSIPPPPSPISPLARQAAREPRALELDLETLIAGRWLNRIGILALLLAVAFFLKYAFDNNWVGPRGRVAIGLLFGSSLLTSSRWLLRRGYHYFSEGIAGLGAAVLYLSLFAGWSYYHLFPQAAAFAGMIVVTAAMVAVAIGRDSQRIALLALMGGFLTPLLLSTGKDQQVVLFTYLGILDASLLALARARNWRSLELLSFLWTQVFFWGWYDRFYDPSKLFRTGAFATLFFVLFAAVPVARSLRLGELVRNQILLVLINAFWFLLALRALLWPERRWILTVAVLGLAAGHLVVARAVRRFEREGIRLAQLLFAGLALTFVTLAIPIRLEGKWITITWAVEGAVLLWSGLRAREQFLRGAGFLLFGVVALRLLLFPIVAERFLWNPRFATFAVAVACFVLTLVFARRRPERVSDAERGLFAVLAVAVNVFALWALSFEVFEAFGRMRPRMGLDTDLAQQLALSLLWTVYATGLILLGVRREAVSLRWQALALFGLVVGKVFLYDLSFLERVYRIISFVVLGVVLLVVSFLYQRRLAASRPGENP
jgi:uncharacterized membrane protein